MGFTQYKLSWNYLKKIHANCYLTFFSVETVYPFLVWLLDREGDHELITAFTLIQTYIPHTLPRWVTAVE